MDSNKNNNRGFTLAEMLIVVAIIGVLVAIVSTSISNALEKSREAVDMANIRNAMSETYNAYLNGQTSKANGIEVKTYDGNTYYCKDIKMKQTESGWTSSKNSKGYILINDTKVTCTDDMIKLNGFRVKYIVEKDIWQVSKPNKALK